MANEQDTLRRLEQRGDPINPPPRITCGTAAVPISASTTGELVVAHGLGTVPRSAVATAKDDWQNAVVYDVNAQTMKVRVNAVDGVARTQTTNVYWMAMA